MNKTTSNRTKFDIEEYSLKLLTAIKKLRETQQPGKYVGTGSKTEVLSTQRKELQQLLADGYTPAQIAEALKEDVFSILPKTITQIVRRTKPSKPRATKGQTKNEIPPASESPSYLPPLGSIQE